MVNYTPINLDVYFKKDPGAEAHKGSLNFVLLIIALITAVIFAILLFVMIKNKREEKITIPPETPVQNIKRDVTTPTIATPIVTHQTGPLPTNFVISPTLIPEENIESQ